MKRKRQNVKPTKDVYVSCVPSTPTSLSKMNAEEGPQKLVPKLKLKRIKLDERNGGVNKTTKVLPSEITDRKSSNVDTEEKTEVKTQVAKLKRISFNDSNDGENNEPKASCSTATDTKSHNVTTEENTAETTEGKLQKTNLKRKRHKVKQTKALFVVLSSVSKLNAEVDSRTGDKLVPKLTVKRIKVDDSNDEVNKEPKASSSTSTGTKACSAIIENKTEEILQTTSDICKTCRNKDDQPFNESPDKRREAIERCVRSLEHSQSCNDLNCLLSDCCRMKRVVAHLKRCLTTRRKGTCLICKQLIALCYYHAKRCGEVICHVPFCRQIKRRQEIMSLQEELQMRQRKLRLKRRY